MKVKSSSMFSVFSGFLPSRQSAFRRFSVVAMILSLAFAGVAQTLATPPVTPQPTSGPSQPAAPHVSATTPNLPAGVTGISSRYRISPGDELDISVYGAPELTQRSRVSGQGEIYLPLVNKLHVAGLTIEGAQSAIETALREGNFVNAPHVNIAVAAYANAVVVMGEVARPGSYPLLGSGKLFDVLSAAGGTTGTAGHIITISHQDGTRENVTLGKDPAETMDADVPLSQGDTVDVPKAGVVYIVGEVFNPAGIVMDQKIQYTVLKVVAMAHGPTRLAKLSKARIVRQVKGGGTQEIPVPLDKIMVSKAPDVPLLAEDILFIPNNTAKQVAGQATQIAVGLASGVLLIGAQRF
jgi:polysaccharide export outer membrane protein